MVSALDSGSRGPGSSPGRGTVLCSWERHLLSNLENREHLKYFGDVYCVMTNHTGDQDTRANRKTAN